MTVAEPVASEPANTFASFSDNVRVKVLPSSFIDVGVVRAAKVLRRSMEVSEVDDFVDHRPVAGSCTCTVPPSSTIATGVDPVRATVCATRLGAWKSPEVVIVEDPASTVAVNE